MSSKYQRGNTAAAWLAEAMADIGGWAQAAQGWFGNFSLDPNKSGNQNAKDSNSDEQNNTSFTSSAEQRKQSEQSNRAETMQEPATGGMAPGEWGLDSARQRLSARSNGKMSVPISNTEASASRMSSQKNQPVAHDGMAIKERIEMLEAVNTALMRHVHEMAWEAHVSNANQFSQRTWKKLISFISEQKNLFASCLEMNLL
jgi:hypothetical protein